ncbi:HAD hydrolase-like protein [bacterium]|nr:HAD hydrolase-like protein [bacterium]
MYKTILFDLDGTLTDSKEGIINSLIHTLNHFGLPIPAEEADLLSFIGPPLYDSFTTRYQFTPFQCNEVLAVYREHYRGIGVYQNKLYPGVESMLTVLQEHGCRMGLATAKGDWTANKVVDDFKLRPYISDVFASVPEKNRNYKHEIIAHALQEMDGAAAKETIMVGDRASDIHGA